MMVKRGSLARKYRRVGWGMVLLPTLLMLAFTFWPMVEAFMLSLQSGKGMMLKYAGFANYGKLFTDRVFLEALKNTLIYTAVQVPVMIFLAMFSAVLLNKSYLRLRGVLRTSIFLPCVTSLVAYSILFKSLFAHSGLVNGVLTSLNLVKEPISWLTHQNWAKVTIMLAMTWRWTGYNMIFFLSGMQNIDPEIYESALLDGANARQSFFYITFPLLKPIILFTTVTSTNGTLRMFDEVNVITEGGPGNATLSISVYIYNLCFKNTPRFGYAAAVSYSIVFFVIVLAGMQFLLARDKD